MEAGNLGEKDPTRAWLEVRGLSKRLGGAQVLSAVDMDIYRGEVHALVGANGAGKSTLIRHLAGLLTPDEGTISLNGTEVVIGETSRARITCVWPAKPNRPAWPSSTRN